MLIPRSALLASVLALAAPAFAASPTPVTDTTRDQRMAAALSDFQSGKPAESVPAKPMKSTPSHGSKHHQTKK
ncbi:hypothetical protein QTI66_13905 [Variovorax sp. J22R133]|uniref:hypothetical protein n=1 Tax=Variovorax brevis TaxID=3053503 RepID=UPI0025770186|nr:hypothetical protein [Variovorax sp. J22R133]MDM0113248.1 hypothetical protein [Variovorax sp. J22R133]